MQLHIEEQDDLGKKKVMYRRKSEILHAIPCSVILHCQDYVYICICIYIYLTWKVSPHTLSLSPSTSTQECASIPPIDTFLQLIEYTPVLRSVWSQEPCLSVGRSYYYDIHNGYSLIEIKDGLLPMSIFRQRTCT